jgi:general stress protein 26
MMSNEAAIRKSFWKDLSESPYVMIGLTNGHEHSIPMTVHLDRNANHAVWFFTSRDNRLAPGGPAMAQFAGKDHYLFACINGTLVEETDQAVIDHHWTRDNAAWYAGGRTDPNLLVLRFDLGTAEIWRADVSIRGMFKMLFGGDARAEMQSNHAEVAL